MHDTNRIGGYLYNPMFRGYIHASWPFEPMKVVDGQLEVHEVLDHITAAVESGQLRRDAWPEQLFASEADLHAFLDGLREHYDDIFRIVDRWWLALSNLLQRYDEEMLITGSHVAEAFAEGLHELKKKREAAAKKAPRAKRAVKA